jgi:cyclopropane-fatty-acyl-phospholipid synthase
MIHEVDEIGAHYAETLCRWRNNIRENIDEVRRLGYDERFERTWNFYLSFCEAAFRTRALRDVQLTLTRPFNEVLA